MQPVVTSVAVCVPVNLAACYRACVRARRGKKPSYNQLAFQARWLTQLQALHRHLRAGTWQSRPTACFTVTRPKTREIHAPDFADRIVHHLLVERLNKLYEPVFVVDSYANRTGKGSHAAVDRLQQFMRQHDNMAAAWAQAWYLQLDVHNYFNSIHRPTLYAMLCARLAQSVQRGLLPNRHALALRSLCHKLLARPTVAYAVGALHSKAIPAHKQLRYAAPGCGLPVGNLSSQFFANVYLNALDQFVKHTLKVRHYVRYVDDFVLLANGAEQLQAWRMQIEDFLHTQLRLKLKASGVVQPCSQGIDFLGYRIFSLHRWVRPRVVQHCRAKLAQWEREHQQSARVSATDFAQLQALLGSYWGHFSHANSVRLRRSLFVQFPWLVTYFELQADGSLQVSAPARWQVRRRQALHKVIPHEPIEVFLNF